MKRSSFGAAAATLWTDTMQGKRLSVEHLRAVARYEEIRTTLLEDGGAVYLEKPLAHWVLPADRRLPLIFLGRPLGKLLQADFDELAATPGVGRKKIRSFLDLLERVADSIPARASGNGRDSSREGAPPADSLSVEGFNADNVSELVWNEWQETVRRCGLDCEPLGRVAPTLKSVTRVIWRTPLAEYLGVPLAELRNRKTYGEKRVRAVLEAFYGLHRLLSDLGSHDQLTIRLVPRHIDRMERWVGQCLQRTDLPRSADLTECYVEPMIDQLRHDASQQIVELAEIRLGIRGPITTIRQTARQMGLTRARIYQLMNEINDILSVRWPQGRCLSYRLLERLEADGGTTRDQFHAAVELFYPRTRRAASDAVEETTGRSVA